MAKTKTKQIGDVNKNLDSSNSSSHHHSTPTDYQIAPVAAPELLVGDTTLQNLAVIEDEVVTNPVVVDTPTVAELPAVVDPVVVEPPVVEPPVVIEPPVAIDPPVIVYPPDIIDIPPYVLIGGAGNDTLNGGDGNNEIYGGAGDDVINGGAGDDRLIGRQGNDTLSGGEGNDLMSGGDGFNTFNVDAGTDTIQGYDSTDNLNVSAGATALVRPTFHGHDSLDVDYGVQLIETMEAYWMNGYDISVANANNLGTIILTGAEGNDYLAGSAGIDILIGNAGADTLVGGAGDDTLIGGEGSSRWTSGVILSASELPFQSKGDLLTGGAGSDTFQFDLNTDAGNTWATADTITDFISNIDKLNFNTSAGTNSNFVEANGSGFADEAATLAAAQAAMDGTAQYYLAYNVGGDGYLYYDADGVDGGEVVVKLLGLTDATHFNFTDIV